MTTNSWPENFIKKYKPCSVAQDYLRTQLDAMAALQNCDNIHWLQWISYKQLHISELQWLALDRAKAVLCLYESCNPGDLRLRRCLEVTEGFLLGWSSK